MRASSLRLLLLLLAAAGCYRSPGAALEPRSAPRTGPVPLSAPPRIAWREHRFAAAHLPAVSADGAAVLIGIQDADGGRGNPNYRLEVRDRRDAKIAGHIVLAADEADSMFDADGKTAELDQRIAAANRWLGEQHRARRLVPLLPLAVLPGPAIASAFRATGGGVTLEWRPSRLTIAQGGKLRLDRATPPTWLAEARPRPAGMPECHNPAYLGAAYLGAEAISLEHRVALLQIAYGGTDTCWEPNAAYHVVAW